MVLPNATGAAPINATGYTTVNNYTSGGRTDQAISSRQELISFLLGTNTAGTFSSFNPNVLMYLGTFSRAVNAPSWSPQADASTLGGSNGTPAIYAYQTNAALSTGTATPFTATSPNPNRNIPNVRFPASGSVIHYDDSGNPVVYAVQAGAPLVQRRFSLAKLAWIGSGGPVVGPGALSSSLTTAQKNAAIQACFGLQWNSGTNAGGYPIYRWEYVGPVGSTTRSSIETLDQVGNSPSTNTADNAVREPNFFELLKAGILNGSLGRDPGPGMDQNVAGFNSYGTGTGVFEGGGGGVGVYGGFYVPGPPAYNYKAAPDLQIVQIGVNIIDQARADSYPTAIHLEYWPSVSTEDEVAINTVYGDKNLPGINAASAILLADPMPTATTASSGTVTDTVTAGKLNGWFQLYLWNIHQVPTGTLPNYPTEFSGPCLRRGNHGMDSKVVPSGITVPNSGKPNYNKTITYYDDGTGVDATGGRGDVYFNNPADATSPFYSQPRILNLILTTGSTGTGGD